MSLPNSVGVKSDAVEMLSVGEETVVDGILMISGGYSESCEMEGDAMLCKVEEGGRCLCERRGDPGEQNQEVPSPQVKS